MIINKIRHPERFNILKEVLDCTEDITITDRNLMSLFYVPNQSKINT